MSKDKDSESSDEKPQPFKIEILEKVSTLIAAAFGFVAAFAWNETFKILLLPKGGEELRPIILISYALFVTLLAVILTIIVARAAAKAKKALQ